MVLDFFLGWALIDIEKQPKPLVHFIGVSKPDCQIAQKCAQRRVSLAELAPHSVGTNNVYHRVSDHNRPRGAFTPSRD